MPKFSKHIIPSLLTVTASSVVTFPASANDPYDCESLFDKATTLSGQHFTINEENTDVIDYFNQLHASNLNKKLVELSSLQKGWDGYGANILSNKVIRNTNSIIAQIPDKYFKDLREENIVPTSNGTITLEWESEEGNYLVLDIGIENLTIYLEFKDQLFSKENLKVEEIDTGSMQALLTFVYR